MYEHYAEKGGKNLQLKLFMWENATCLKILIKLKLI